MVFVPPGNFMTFLFPRSGTSGWPGPLKPGPPSAFGPTGPHSCWDTWARTSPSILAGEWTSALPSLHHSTRSLSTLMAEWLFFYLLRLCRYHSVVDLVKSWSEEKRHYLFPAPKDCTPRCPWRCSGPVCSHYTQVHLCWDVGLMREQILLEESECGGTAIRNKTEALNRLPFP